MDLRLTILIELRVTGVEHAHGIFGGSDNLSFFDKAVKNIV